MLAENVGLTPTTFHRRINEGDEDLIHADAAEHSGSLDRDIYETWTAKDNGGSDLEPIFGVFVSTMVASYFPESVSVSYKLTQPHAAADNQNRIHHRAFIKRFQTWHP